MGEWSRQNLSPEARVVAFDLGGFTAASGLYVVDQSGLVDPAGLDSFRQHNSPEFYRARHATHLFKFEEWDESDLVINPVWQTDFQLLHRIVYPDCFGLDREACQNAWDRCSLYRIIDRKSGAISQGTTSMASMPPESTSQGSMSQKPFMSARAQ
jgi:hypothetical protein